VTVLLPITKLNIEQYFQISFMGRLTGKFVMKVIITNMVWFILSSIMVLLKGLDTYYSAA